MQKSKFHFLAVVSLLFCTGCPEVLEGPDSFVYLKNNSSDTLIYFQTARNMKNLNDTLVDSRIIDVILDGTHGSPSKLPPDSTVLLYGFKKSALMRNELYPYTYQIINWDSMQLYTKEEILSQNKSVITYVMENYQDFVDLDFVLTYPKKE